MVRRQRWRVIDVRLHATGELVSLVGIGPANAGVEREFLTPFDNIDAIEAVHNRPRRVGIKRWRHACRRLIAAHGSSCALRAAGTAAIDLLPHQLEPVLAILKGLGTRVLIADDVGLGKTVQAGLVLAELRARGAADRVLVLVPAGLREQWIAELAARFRIDAVLMDARGVRRRAQELPLGTNPWSTLAVAVTSLDYIKRPEVRPSVEECLWDLVIVDEAHNAAILSDRHTAVAAICARSVCVVLLTATPHNGDADAFESLCGIGAHRDRLLVFRRTRHHVAGCLRRRVHHLSVSPTAAEQGMHAALAVIGRAVARNRHDAWLMLGVLHKRALSSASALVLSVSRRIDMLENSGQAGGSGQLVLPMWDGDGELDAGDEPPPLTAALLDDPAAELRLLKSLAHAAKRAAATESKIRALIRLLRRLRQAGERAIVFTEYRDTLVYLQSCLRLRTAALHGGLTRSARRAALESFERGGADVLLATDAGGEGLNLHEHCRVVINLELPWNPMRLEQRIGRVDRIGQRRPVHAWHFIARGTSEIDILHRLHAKVARARRDVAAANPLVSHRVHGEAAIARWLAGDSDLPDSDLAGAAPRLDDFSEEAAVEHARLSLTRSLNARALCDHPGDELRPLVANAGRRRRTRVRLAGRQLSIFETVWEDGCGRTVACQVQGAVHDQNLSHAAVASAIRIVSDEGLGSSHKRFVTTRLRRCRAIASAEAAARITTSQPGLFDRRADRDEAAAAAKAGDRREELHHRIAAAVRAAAVARQMPRLVLVLES